MKKRRTSILLGGIFILFFFILPFIGNTKTVEAASSIAVPGSVKAVTTSYQDISISWNKVTGVSGYAVYRATSSNGSYTLKAYVTTNGYKDTGLITGNTYYYKIRAYKTSGKTKTFGAYSAKVYARVIPSAPASVKVASTTYNSIMVTFGGVTGASGYSVYRATSLNGTYDLLCKTKNKSYTDTGLTTGKTYYYKIRAYRQVGSGIVYSNYSSVVQSKPLPSSPLSVKVNSLSVNSIGLSWSKVIGASGYGIYQSKSSNGTYTLLGTTTALSLQNRGLSPATSYYYKVRAYKTVGSSKVYGNYSAIVSATTKEIEVTSITLDQNLLTLNTGETAMLNAVIAPADATNQTVQWSSSDPSIILVDNTGTVTATGAGTAEITVTSANGNVAALCAVTVNQLDNPVDNPADNQEENPDENTGDDLEDVSIEGIDVSKWQGNINWSQVKNAGIEFAMIRSSYGSSSVDPKFEANYKGAKDNGISVGAYHYSYATSVKKAEEEVEFFINTLEGKKFEYPVCVDVEDASMKDLSKATLTEIVLTYLTKLSDAGYYPMVYSNKTWFTNKLSDPALDDYDHWLAEWTTSYTYTGSVGIWQYSSTGKVSGISTNVDLNISFIDYKKLIQSLQLNGF